MSKINGGATLWARQTIDSDIFYNKPHVWFKIWFYLINEVNHKDNKQFKRGSCFMKYDWIMEKTKAKKNEIDHCIRWLKSATMIATAKATRGFIVNVINYNGYQSLENYKSDTKSDSKSDLKAKQKRNKSDTINKNDNNDKNDIEEIVKVRQLIAASLGEKPKENDPLEFDFEEKCWWGLYDWRIKKYQGSFPRLTINYLFNDKWKNKFLGDPVKYQKMLKDQYNDNWENMIWAWLQQENKNNKIPI